jgi:hypothetical protein
MNSNTEIPKLTIFYVYIYFVASLMISEAIVYIVNGQFDWIIRRQVINWLPESAHHTYLELQFFLTLFSIMNVIVLPIVAVLLGVLKKDILPIIVSLIASIFYSLLLYQLRDGII